MMQVSTWPRALQWPDRKQPRGSSSRPLQSWVGTRFARRAPFRFLTRRSEAPSKAHGEGVVFTRRFTGRRLWLPLLVSWDAKRHRRDVHWRSLSVSEKSRNIAADRAIAATRQLGKSETYVIYRSLAKSGPSRFFSGHQTTARFLVGRFNRDGVVEPILSVD